MQHDDPNRPTDQDGRDPEHLADDPGAGDMNDAGADNPGPEDDGDEIAYSDADRIAELEADLASAKDQQLRALADVENMRRRAQREREEALKYGAVSLARDLLGVSDNLGRAIAAAESEADDSATKSLVEGIGMVEKELIAALEKHHVRPVPGAGEPFDPNVHQAVVEIESADIEPGHVAQVMQTGYTLHERLLRPAMVAVAKAPAGSGDEPA